MSGCYTKLKIQPVDYITANNIDFCSGNIIKYASRWNLKGQPEEDLKKIIDYANILLNKREWEGANE
jgi:hypothetical protein